MARPDELQLTIPRFNRLPDQLDISADYTHPTSSVENARDGLEHTYWYSGYSMGNLRILFTGGKEWISILRIKTWSPQSINNEFTIYGKVNRSDSSWTEIGKKNVVVTASQVTPPQTVDIDVVWNEYEMIQIKCSGLGVINEIEIF